MTAMHLPTGHAMTKVEESCGNVFQDLGLPDADKLLAKAKADLALYSKLRPYEAATDLSITVGLSDGPVSVATCGLTRMPEYWWVSRVFVREQYRRHQLGSHCLSRALQLAEQDQGSPRHVVVAPGGYNMPYQAQCRFYRRHGFVGRGTMTRDL
jgi:GNAT superfamily N-acetyltransferase